MRFIFKIVCLFFLVVSISCKDTKKEEESKEDVVQIEQLESDVEDITSDLETQEQQLQEVLKQLDSI